MKISNGVKNKNMATVSIFILSIIAAVVLPYLIEDLYSITARSVNIKGGVNLTNNVNIRAGEIDQWNGSLSTTTGYFAQATGGVDDYNNNQTIPADTFTENWTVCTSANSYCSTNDATACYVDAENVCRRDNRTNLVWSDRILGGVAHNWFVANNCWVPGSVQNPGSCAANGNPACQCVKQTQAEATASCMALGDGNWRLPYQKELMQVYIDGSWGNLPNAGDGYWSATTLSNGTDYAWRTGLSNGGTGGSAKTDTTDSRCVRR